MRYQPHLRRVRTFPDEATGQAFYRRNYSPLMRDLPEGPILDIGCGLGDFLVFCGQGLERRAVGIDLDAENAAVCQAAKLDAVQAEARDFLARPDTYAGIVLNDVIEHVAKDQIIPLLSLMHQRLVPGGRVILKTPNMANPLIAGRNRYIDITHQVGFTEESLIQVLEQAGFDDILVAPVDIYVTANPIANLGGRVLSAIMYAVWRLGYKVQGVPKVRVLTKGIMAVGTRSVTADTP